MVLVFHGEFDQREGTVLDSFMDSFHTVFIFMTTIGYYNELVLQAPSLLTLQ